MNRRDFLKAILSLPALALLPLPELPQEKQFEEKVIWYSTGKSNWTDNGLEDFITTGKREDGNDAGRFIVDGFLWVEKNGYFKLVEDADYVDNTPKIHTSLRSNLTLDFGKYISDDGGFSWKLKNQL